MIIYICKKARRVNFIGNMEIVSDKDETNIWPVHREMKVESFKWSKTDCLSAVWQELEKVIKGLCIIWRRSTVNRFMDEEIPLKKKKRNWHWLMCNGTKGKKKDYSVIDQHKAHNQVRHTRKLPNRIIWDARARESLERWALVKAQTAPYLAFHSKSGILQMSPTANSVEIWIRYLKVT